MFLSDLNERLWNGPMLIILLVTHIFLTFKTGFVQVKTATALKLLFFPNSKTLNKSNDTGSIGKGTLHTLTTTLAATLGTGNIVGISTAVALGGPGAVFWCWLTGLLGMATTYSECYLGSLFKHKKVDGSYISGPMCSLKYGLNANVLAVIYAACALFAALGMGCSTQAYTLTESVRVHFDIPPYIIGIITAAITGIIINGGAKGVHKFCFRLIPALSIFYILACFVIMGFNYGNNLNALVLIISSAFKAKAVCAGVAGGGLMLAARYGISRGLFSNEAGLGTASFVTADSSTTPEKQALISMSATFFDTIIMCTITGIVIVGTMLSCPALFTDTTPTELTTIAFSRIPYIGTFLLSFSLVAFALATLIGWSYFAEKAADFLLGQKGILICRFLYILTIFTGSVMSLDLVWELADFANALLAIPNVLALFFLRKHIRPYSASL